MEREENRERSLCHRKIQNETYDFSQACFTVRKSAPCLFHPLETISPERNEENVTTIVLVPMTGGR